MFLTALVFLVPGCDGQSAEPSRSSGSPSSSELVAPTHAATTESDLGPATPFIHVPEGVVEIDRQLGGSITLDATLPAPGFIVAYTSPVLSVSAIVGISDALPAGETRGVEVSIQPLETAGELSLAFHEDRDQDGVLGLDFGEGAAPGAAGDQVLASVGYMSVPPLPGETIDGGASIEAISIPVESDGLSFIIPSVTLETPGFLVVYEPVLGTSGVPLGASELLLPGTSHDLDVAFADPVGSQTLLAAIILDGDGDGSLASDTAIDPVATNGDGTQVTAAVALVVPGLDPDTGAEVLARGSLPLADMLGPGWTTGADDRVESLWRPRALADGCVRFNEASRSLEGAAARTRIARVARNYARVPAGALIPAAEFRVEVSVVSDPAILQGIVDLYAGAFADGTFARCLQEGATGPRTRQNLVVTAPSVLPATPAASFAVGSLPEDNESYAGEYYVLVRGSRLVVINYTATGANPAEVSQLVSAVERQLAAAE